MFSIDIFPFMFGELAWPLKDHNGKYKRHICSMFFIYHLRQECIQNSRLLSDIDMELSYNMTLMNFCYTYRSVLSSVIILEDNSCSKWEQKQTSLQRKNSESE